MLFDARRMAFSARATLPALAVLLLLAAHEGAAHREFIMQLITGDIQPHLVCRSATTRQLDVALHGDSAAAVLAH